MAEFDHWMRFNIGDYLADTMHLSALQHGMYVLLIMHYFKRGPLPADDKVLARIAKVTPLIWRRNGAVVCALFQRKKSVFLHTRIEHEIALRKVLSAKRANAGKSGASRRWGMANANVDDGNSHSPARRRARDSHNHSHESPHEAPHQGGRVVRLDHRRKRQARGAAAVREILNDQTTDG